MEAGVFMSKMGLKNRREHGTPAKAYLYFQINSVKVQTELS